jgi:phage N-6-adenine-methyltransferase
MDDIGERDALAIGRLYSSARGSSSGRVFYLKDAGDRLLLKKESLGHGLWLAWLRSNQSLLGLTPRAAQNLIQGAQWLASNWQIANRLEEIVTDPFATGEALAAADEIRQLIAAQFRPAVRGTLGRRQQRMEWYTPHEYIALARAVLGDIDIDPASTEYAQETVKARQFFDKAQNGLLNPWYGRVWLNPPYAQPLISRFINKLLMEWNAGRIQSCITLTHNYTDSVWFHDAAAAADAVCFTQGRIKFYDPDGELAKPTQGQAFFYFGSEVDTFKQTFGRVGLIVRSDELSRRRMVAP